MSGQRTTNVLLLLIFIVLLANLAVRFELKSAKASPGDTDDAVTISMTDKPAGYVHVVLHQAPGDKVIVKPEYDSTKPAWDKK